MHLECNGVSIIIKFFQRLIEQIGQILIHVIINTHQVNKIELNFISHWHLYIDLYNKGEHILYYGNTK